jgi:glycosyltransferase involved in cell wall biosynthesis
MKIGIHITTYNRFELTEKCILSLFLSNPEDIEIVIVDNNSTDKTKNYLQNLKHKDLKQIIYNNENKGLGYAVNQGWDILQNSCDILAWMDNDFLYEPGWDKNVRACFSELGVDFITGLSNQTVKQKHPVSEPKTTKSGIGKYVLTENFGGGNFLLTKFYKNKIIYVEKLPFHKGYTGPGSSFNHLLRKKGLKGIRLNPPGILLLNPQYTSDEYKDYYNECFSSRGMENRLNIYRETEKSNNGIAEGIEWKDFLSKYYPDLLEEK